MIDGILPIPKLLISDLMRFWSKVDCKGEDECWLWIGCKNENSDGDYGRFSINYKMYLSHRISYFIHYNKDPGSLLICHKCNNPPCINPKHLFLGNNSKNKKQSFSEGRSSHKGILHPRAKLQESDIKEIRNMKGKLNYRDVAKIFNISPKSIHNIWSGHSWSHL